MLACDMRPEWLGQVRRARGLLYYLTRQQRSPRQFWITASAETVASLDGEKLLGEYKRLLDQGIAELLRILVAPIV